MYTALSTLVVIIPNRVTNRNKWPCLHITSHHLYHNTKHYVLTDSICIQCYHLIDLILPEYCRLALYVVNLSIEVTKLTFP